MKMKASEFEQNSLIRRILQEAVDGDGFAEVLDNHDNKVKKIENFVVLANSEVCPCFKGSFCLNPIMLDDDGGLHLSTWSTGGVVHATRSLQYGILRYNTEVSAQSLWDMFAKKLIVDVIGEAPRLEDGERREAVLDGLNNVCFADGYRAIPIEKEVIVCG